MEGHQRTSAPHAANCFQRLGQESDGDLRGEGEQDHCQSGSVSRIGGDGRGRRLHADGIGDGLDGVQLQKVGMQDDPDA